MLGYSITPTRSFVVAVQILLLVAVLVDVMREGGEGEASMIRILTAGVCLHTHNSQ